MAARCAPLCDPKKSESLLDSDMYLLSAYKPDEGTLVKIGQFMSRPEYKFESDRKSCGWCYWVKDRQ